MTIGRQMYPEHPHFIVDAYRQATAKRYGYLLLDCTPTGEHRVREGLFPDEPEFIYVPK